MHPLFALGIYIAVVVVILFAWYKFQSKQTKINAVEDNPELNTRTFWDNSAQYEDLFLN